MAYTISEPQSGYLQIANIDTGYVPPGNGTTAIPTPPAVLGDIIRGFDPVYGGGEFILLKGVASTLVGSVVVYDATTYVTALATTTDNQARPVAISMAANTAATTFSWYQISGSAVVQKVTGSPHQIQPNVAVGVFSVGKIASTASAGAGNEIENARYSSTVTASSASSTCVIVIDRPHLQGRIT